MPPAAASREFAVNSAMVAAAVGFGLLNDQNVVFGFRHYSLALRATDLVLGVGCIAGLCAWRRRYPVAFALASIAIGVVSTLAAGVALVAVFTVAIHQPWRPAVVISVLAAASVVPSLALYPVAHGERTVAVGILITFAVTGWGMFVRARRLLLDSLRTQLDAAESAATARADAARRGERERIAREMHDVLAHRLSLLAVHAGALEFNSAAPADEVARAAGVIRANTHDALDDLRSVISVLREPEADGDHRRPQPTLGDLPALVEESRAAGLAVRCDELDAVAGRDVPAAAGRTVYRVVQEALTNARKHAPYARVDVDVAARPGEGIAVRVSNEVQVVAAVDALPGSGTGLIGLRERVTLAGGRIDFGSRPDGRFEVSAWVPWTGPEVAGA